MSPIADAGRRAVQAVTAGYETVGREYERLAEQQRRDLERDIARMAGPARTVAKGVEHLVVRPVAGLGQMALGAATFGPKQAVKGISDIAGLIAAPKAKIEEAQQRSARSREMIAGVAKQAAQMLGAAAQDPQKAAAAIGRFGIDQWRQLRREFERDPWSASGMVAAEALLWVGLPLVDAYRLAKGTSQAAEIMRGYREVEQTLAGAKAARGIERASAAERAPLLKLRKEREDIQRLRHPVEPRVRPPVPEAVLIEQSPKVRARAQAMRAQAEREAPRFLEDAKGAAAASGARFADEFEQYVVKGEAGIGRKLARGTPVSDAVRGTIEIRAPEQAETVLRDLEQRGYRVVEVLNRWTDPKFENWTYKDISVKIIREDEPGALIHEVQMITPAMLQTKKREGHSIYEVTRRLDDLQAEGGYDKRLVERVQRAREHLRRYSDQVYLRAMEADRSLAIVSTTSPISARALRSSVVVAPPAASTEARRSFRGLLKILSEPTLARRSVSSEVRRGLGSLLAPSIEAPSTFRVARPMPEIQVPAPARAAPAVAEAPPPLPPPVRGLAEVVPPRALEPTPAVPRRRRRVPAAPGAPGRPGVPGIGRPVLVEGDPRGYLVNIRRSIEGTNPGAAEQINLALTALDRRSDAGRYLEAAKRKLEGGTGSWTRARAAIDELLRDPRVRREIAAAAPPPRGLAAVVPEEIAATPFRGPTGSTVRAATPAGTEVDLTYGVTSARDLATSHDTALRLNPGYPSVLQPRMRERAASQKQLQDFVEKTRVETLGASDDVARGAPVIGPDGVVESGNMRTIGLKKLYELKHPNGQRYKAWLAEHAAEFGLDPQAIAAIADPVLVRVRKTGVDRARFVREANMGTQLKMSATEQAMSDATLVPDDLMRLFQPSESGDVATPANRGFITRFVQTVAPTAAEQGDMLMPSGQLSAQGIRRIQNAVLAKAYGDVTALEKLIESPDLNVRSIANAMLSAAPRMATVRSQMARGELYPLDLSGDVAKAMTKLSELREAGTPVELYLSQVQMFPDPAMTEEAKRLLAFFGENARRPKRITEFLTRYADQVERLGNPRQVGLAGEREIPSKVQILDALAQPPTRGLADVVPLAPVAGLPRRQTRPVPRRHEGPSLEEVSRQNLTETTQELALEGQRGALRLGTRPVPAPAPGVSPNVQQMLAMGRPGVRERMGEALTRTKERMRNYFVPEGALLDVRTAPGATAQELRDDFRLFRDVPRTDVPERVTKDIIGVVAPLERAEYDTFQNYVIMRDLAEEYEVAGRVGRRPSIPLGLSENEVRQALTEYETALTPKGRAAVQRHDRLKAAQRDEFIRRGLGDAEDFREYHFRHFTLDYDEIFGGAVGVPRGRLKEPRRTELKGRTGSQRPILTDYIEVRQKELSRMYLDNAIDDFMAEIQPKIDWLPVLSKDQRIALFGPKGRPARAGQMVTLDDGTRLMAWQYTPGNMMFPGYTLDAKLLESITTKTITGDELAALLAGQDDTTRKVARQMLVLGQKHPMILVDPAIAKRLSEFNQGKDRNELFEAVSAFSGMWKRAIVDSLGLPFQFRNMLGDLENGMVVGGGKVATPLLKAASLLVREAYGKPLSAQEQDLLNLAKRYRVVRSGFTAGTLRSRVAADPRLQHLLSRGEQIARLPGKALGEYERVAGIREDAGRLAHFMDNMERIQRGEVLRTGAIDVAGLPPVRAAGKVAREAFVDYGWKSPFEEKWGRGALAPFVSWYYQNTKNWVKLGARRPATLAAKTVPVYGAMTLWNNTGERAEIEKNLPPWQRMMPHIITGWRLPDGRPLIVGFQGGSASAAQVLGLTRVFEAANTVASGEFTTEEALARLPGDVVQEILRGAAFQIGPVVTIPAELAMFGASRGKMVTDIRRGQERIPERLRGTAAGGRKFLMEEARAAIPPLNIVLRQQEAGRTLPPGTSLAQRAAMGTGLMRPVDLPQEQRRRMIDVIEREKAAREDKLFAIEQAYIRSGDPLAAAEEAKRQNEQPGPILSGKEINTRLTSTRVQIERTREEIRTNQDPAKAAALRAQLDRLLTLDMLERTKRAPKSVRPLVVPKVQRPSPAPDLDLEDELRRLTPPTINIEEELQRVR